MASRNTRNGSTTQHAGGTRVVSTTMSRNVGWKCGDSRSRRQAVAVPSRRCGGAGYMRALDTRRWR